MIRTFVLDSGGGRNDFMGDRFELICQVADLAAAFESYGRRGERRALPELTPETGSVIARGLRCYLRELEDEEYGRGPFVASDTITPADREAAGVTRPGKLEEYLNLIGEQRRRRLSLRAFCEQSQEIVGHAVSYATMRRANQATVMLETYREQNGESAESER